MPWLAPSSVGQKSSTAWLGFRGSKGHIRGVDRAIDLPRGPGENHSQTHADYWQNPVAPVVVGLSLVSLLAVCQGLLTARGDLSSSISNGALGPSHTSGLLGFPFCF